MQQCNMGEQEATRKRRRSRGGKLKRSLGKKGIELVDAESIAAIADDVPQSLDTKSLSTDESSLHNGKEELMAKTDKEKSKKTRKKSKAKDDTMVTSSGDGVKIIEEEMTKIAEKKKKKHKGTSKTEEPQEAEEKTSGKKRKRKVKVKQHDESSSKKKSKLSHHRDDQNSIKNGTKSKTDRQSLKQKKNKKESSKKTKVMKDVFDFATTPKDFLASLIAPCSVQKFFRVFWEKKPMVINRTEEDGYAESYKTLFSRKILEGILTRRNIEFGKDVNVCLFDGKERVSMNGEGRASCKKIKNLLDKERATVQFHQPQRFQDKLWQINERLECFFHSLVGANIYMTPQNSQGLAPHYDDVDVFVLQLEGEKQWKLYNPPIQLPRDYSKDLDKSTIGKPTHNILLKAGDLMYFPRGTVHQAVTPANSPSHSTHVTISTYQRSSWGDLIGMALPGILQTALDEDVYFRRGLPHTYLHGDTESFAAQQAHLSMLLQRLIGHVGSHDQLAANEMMCDLMANRLPPYSKDGTAHEPKGPMPAEESKVRLAFPEHVYVTKTKHKEMDKPDDEEDDDVDDGEYVELIGDDEDEGSEEDGDVEVQEEEEDHDDSEDESEEMMVGDGSYLEQIMTGAEEEEEDGSDEDEEEMDYFYVYHSCKNTRHDHMMTSEPQQWHGLKFPMDWMPIMKQLTDNSDEWTPVSELENVSGRMQLCVSLWSEGLLQVK